MSPPAPWVDLGWVSRFTRKCGTKVDALRAGAPAMTVGQVRTEVEATVSLEFETWGKLQVTLASGSQQTNLLTTAAGAAPNGSGGVAAAPVPLLTGTGPASTATSLNVGLQPRPDSVLAVWLPWMSITSVSLDISAQV